MATNFRSLQERLRERLLTHIAAGDFSGIELARQTGFQQAHISNFLNRKRGLSLEAMDAILTATRISLSDLLSVSPVRSRQPSRDESGSSDFVSIPIVEEGNCTATQVPKQRRRNTIQIAFSFVQQLRPEVRIPRPHWERFIAIRVSQADAVAMSPRLQRNAIIVVDRHHNEVSEHAMYLVRAGNHTVLRYVERMGAQFVLRPHQSGVPLIPLPSTGGHDPLAAIVGRVCLVHLLV